MDGFVRPGLKTGAAVAAAAAGAMLVASQLERGTPWAGFNAMATAIGRGGRRAADGFDPRVTPVGVALLSGGLLAWGLGYRGLLAAAGRRGGVLTGALSALGGYAVDRWVLPRWLVPNFRRTLGPLGAFAKYAAIGLASARAW